jgi:Eukaryotic aspartyl protease
LPYALASSGVIASPAYSLFLNSFDATTGTILFGGVNKAKYEGELETLPVLPVYDNYYSLAIALTEISIEGSSGKVVTTTKNLPLAVSLDSGSTLTSLPQELVDAIYTAIDATYDSKLGYAYVNCSTTSDVAGNITYAFSGATVTVPMSQLVFEVEDAGFPEGTCAVGIVPSEPGVNILGDSFLRSAYVVYDLANNEISLANAKYGNDDDDILEIGTGSDAVPGAKLVASAVSSATGNGVAATATTTASVVTVTTSSGTGTAVTSGTASDTSTSEAGATAKSSSSSSGKAAMPTGSANHLLSGLAGAGLLLLV